MVSRGPFQPLPLCDSVLSGNDLISTKEISCTAISLRLFFPSFMSCEFCHDFTILYVSLLFKQLLSIQYCTDSQFEKLHHTFINTTYDVFTAQIWHFHCLDSLSPATGVKLSNWPPLKTKQSNNFAKTQFRLTD